MLANIAYMEHLGMLTLVTLKSQTLYENWKQPWNHQPNVVVWQNIATEQHNQVLVLNPSYQLHVLKVPKSHRFATIIFCSICSHVWFCILWITFCMAVCYWHTFVSFNFRPGNISSSSLISYTSLCYDSWNFTCNQEIQSVQKVDMWEWFKSILYTLLNYVNNIVTYRNNEEHIIMYIMVLSCWIIWSYH